MTVNHLKQLVNDLLDKSKDYYQLCEKIPNDWIVCRVGWPTQNHKRKGLKFRNLKILGY